MSKEIRFNAFAMNCVGHMAPGLWRRPRDCSDRYIDLNYWTGLARLLERGKFDGLFLADVLGPYDVYQGSADAAIRSGIQIPVNDPLLLVSGMAAVTEHLGFGVTCALTYEHPYSFARRAYQSALESFTTGDPNRRWKIRDIAEFVGLGGRGPVVVGSISQVADLLQQWIEETDVDGFNLAYAVMPETYEDIVSLLVPELQRRGVYKKEYRPGSLREKLFGQGPFLPETHPGRRFRDCRVTS